MQIQQYIKDNTTIILVQNKCDNIKLNEVYHKKQGIYKISAKNGVGISKVLTKLYTILSAKKSKGSYENVIMCNKIQVRLLEGASNAYISDDLNFD